MNMGLVRGAAGSLRQLGSLDWMIEHVEHPRPMIIIPQRSHAQQRLTIREASRI